MLSALGWHCEGPRLHIVRDVAWMYHGLAYQICALAAGIAAGGDAEWRPTLQHVDRVELPPSNRVIDPPGNISAPSFSAAKGQFINYAGAENVIHVLAGQTVLNRIVRVQLRSTGVQIAAGVIRRLGPRECAGYLQACGQTVFVLYLHGVVVRFATGVLDRGLCPDWERACHR